MKKKIKLYLEIIKEMAKKRNCFKFTYNYDEHYKNKNEYKLIKNKLRIH